MSLVFEDGKLSFRVLSVACAALVFAACADAAGPTGPVSFAAVSAGGEHTCGIDAGGAGYCWGSGVMGQLGDGAFGASAVPRSIQLQTGLVSIAAGYGHTCGIAQEQHVWCWGWNLRGQLGNASTVGQGAPIRADTELRFQQVSSGWFHTCALTLAGDAYCWGGNGQGQLGDGTTSERLVPTRVLGGLKFTSVAAGGFHSCGVTTTGELYCWGLNNEGQLGTGTVENEYRPTRAASEVVYAHVNVGYSHSCALDRQGKPWCWGSNAEGELGVAFASSPGVPGSMTPAAVIDVGGGFIDIAAGLAFTCVVASGGGGWCWGRGEDGQLGTGAYRSWVVRQPVADVPDFAGISTGYGTHACGVSRQGVVLCWGRGQNGQLGNRSAASPLPVRVHGVT
jgi:alpha-tubulin suppressor-like RCC1 family protein